DPSAASPTPPPASLVPSASQDPVGGGVPIALVAPVIEQRTGGSAIALKAAFDRATVAIPCGLASISLVGSAVAFDAATCLEADALIATVAAKAGRLGLLPAALVTPAVKVLQVGGADLFGGPKVRAV